MDDGLGREVSSSDWSLEAEDDEEEDESSPCSSGSAPTLSVPAGGVLIWDEVVGFCCDI